MINERLSSFNLRKRLLNPRRGSNPLPSDDRRDALTIERPRQRWWAKVQHMCDLSGSHSTLPHFQNIYLTDTLTETSFAKLTAKTKGYDNLAARSAIVVMTACRYGCMANITELYIQIYWMVQKINDTWVCNLFLAKFLCHQYVEVAIWVPKISFFELTSFGASDY